MPTNSLPGLADNLGDFLRGRRARLRPSHEAGRRRTPGLRREEVAARAGVSVVWYTWLEQGRGGPPSEAALERLARALELDPAGREVLFLLARQHPPPVQPAPPPAVPAIVQRVLDAFPFAPAIVKTATWDVVAWNAAAAAVLSDYAALPPGERNALRRMFSAPDVRRTVLDWEENARMILATFRLDVARSGGCPQAGLLADELAATSADFRRLWADNDLSRHASGTKRLHHPIAGPLALEYAAFPIAEAEGLTMVVFNPVSTADRRAIEGLVAHEAAAA